MKLPNAENAVVDEREVRDYLLSRSHPIGRFKAAFFARSGFTHDHAQLLTTQLLELAGTGEATWARAPNMARHT